MPLFSIPLVVRNDDYLPGYSDRISRCIDALLYAFNKTNIEILLVDYNQNKNKPPFSSIFKHKNIRHVVVTYEQYFSKLSYHMANGLDIIDQYGNKMSAEQFISIHPFPSCWAINVGLHHATGDYFVFTSTDVIAPRNGMRDLLKHLHKGVLFKVMSKQASHEFIAANFSDIKDTGGAGRLNFSRSMIRHARVGNGLFFIMDTASVRELHGYCPYLIHRGKACDYFLSYMADAFGKISYIPNYFVVETTHRKSRPSIGWDFIFRNGTKVFDWRAEYSFIVEWVHRNLGNAEFGKEFTLEAEYERAANILDKLSPLTNDESKL